MNSGLFPFVSVCTPTFNRRPFIPIMLECFRQQMYPMEYIEWIIVDDGTDSIEDLIKDANIPQIKYFRVEKKMKLGEKRNFMHTKTKGDIIVYMDDDDYYPPERISHAVEKLLLDDKALCAGSSEIYVYFNHINSMYKFGPYGKNHATAGTFAFKRKLLNISSYENDACLAEEKHFLKNYTIPFVQLDPMKTILVFSHQHNTFDKKKLLENNNTMLCSKSEKKVDDFIINNHFIKNFFMREIHDLLKKYVPGNPSNKQDVLKQIKEMEIKRKNEQNNDITEENLKNIFNTVKMSFFDNLQNKSIECTVFELIKLLDEKNKMIMELTKMVKEKNTKNDNIIMIKNDEVVRDIDKCNTKNIPKKKFNNISD